MRYRGLFEWSILENYGGRAMTREEPVRVSMELSQCLVAVRGRERTDTDIGFEALVADGTEEQKAGYLPYLASGKMMDCFALSEPATGSNATVLRTAAARDGNDYIVNETKCNITNAPIAGLFTVLTRTNTDGPSSNEISVFLVEEITPALEVGETDRKMGQAGSPVSEVCFKDLRIRASNRTGRYKVRGLQDDHEVLEQTAFTSCRVVYRAGNDSARRGACPCSSTPLVRAALSSSSSTDSA